VQVADTKKWLLLGAHYGASKFSDKVFADGYQFDFGYKLLMAQNLWLTIFATEEHRELEDRGVAIGAFQKADGETIKVLRRYALEIAYQIDEG
jgi:hypothetical protein